MNLVRRLSWPPLAAVCCFLAAIILALLRPDLITLVMALGIGSVMFAVLSLRDAATRNMEP